MVGDDTCFERFEHGMKVSSKVAVQCSRAKGANRPTAKGANKMTAKGANKMTAKGANKMTAKDVYSLIEGLYNGLCVESISTSFTPSH